MLVCPRLFPVHPAGTFAWRPPAWRNWPAHHIFAQNAEELVGGRVGSCTSSLDSTRPVSCTRVCNYCPTNRSGRAAGDELHLRRRCDFDIIMYDESCTMDLVCLVGLVSDIHPGLSGHMQDGRAGPPLAECMKHPGRDETFTTEQAERSMVKSRTDEWTQMV